MSTQTSHRKCAGASLLAFGWPICPKTGRNACPRPRIDAWRSADSRTASKSNLTMPTSSPLSGQLVTIFGGSGYIGNYVAQSLLERGARLRLASRNPQKGFALKPLANLGQLQFMPCDITREAQVEAALDGATHVVNLVGAFDGDLGALMGEAPGMIGRIAAAKGVKAMVHMSATRRRCLLQRRLCPVQGAGRAARARRFPHRHGFAPPRSCSARTTISSTCSAG